MLRGSFEHTVDDKGRVILPQKFRQQLGERFMITKGPGRCLIVMTEEQFQVNFDDKFQSQSILDTDEDTLVLQRFYCGEAAEAGTDSQGRMQIPGSLRTWAEIAPQSPVTVLGLTNRLEIWSKARWDTFNGSLSDRDLVRKKT